MDKFVVRTKLPPREITFRAVPKPPSRQSKIDLLPGVIDLDVVRSLSSSLRSECDAERMLRLLDECFQLRMSIEVLEVTKIGMSLSTVPARVPDERVVRRVQELRELWQAKGEKNYETRKRREMLGLVDKQAPPPLKLPSRKASSARGSEAEFAEVELLETAALNGEATRLAAGKKRVREEGGTSASGGSGAGSSSGSSATASAGAPRPSPHFVALKLLPQQEPSQLPRASPCAFKPLLFQPE